MQRSRRNKFKRYKDVKIMFEDEAGFGRISEPISCWAPLKVRPVVPSQRVREYKTVYGAISPIDGDSFFMVLDKSNTENMSLFMSELSKKFPDSLILLCMDRASWHKSNNLKIHRNIVRFFIPPRTPEMNPIEIVWREIRKLGFKNKVFDSIDAVVQKFNEIISQDITNDMIKSLTLWPWVKELYETRIATSKILNAA
jgi:putative transposase